MDDTTKLARRHHADLCRTSRGLTGARAKLSGFLILMAPARFCPVCCSTMLSIRSGTCASGGRSKRTATASSYNWNSSPTLSNRSMRQRSCDGFRPLDCLMKSMWTWSPSLACNPTSKPASSAVCSAKSARRMRWRRPDGRAVRSAPVCQIPDPSSKTSLRN